MIGGTVARHTINIVRASVTEDDRGDPVTGPATRTPSTGWAVDAGDTTENTDGRDSTTVSYTIRGPFTVDVRSSDMIGLFGVDYEIVGGVLKQPGPSDATSHTIVRLRDVRG